MSYEKKMAVALAVLLVLLSFKSLVLDPYRPVTPEEAAYREFALLVAPYHGSPIPGDGVLYTRRVVRLERVSGDGITEIMIVDSDSGELVEKALDGHYEARIRSYLLGVIPIREFRIEGGVASDGSETNN